MNKILQAVLKSKVAHINQHILSKTAKTSKVRRLPAQPCKEVSWVHWQLSAWCHIKNYELQTEYKFHEVRKWRLDFFIKDIKCGIEYEGIVSKKSRHTTITGYTGDTDKYRQAAIMNIKILRYTALNYKTVLQDLNSISV